MNLFTINPVLRELLGRKDIPKEGVYTRPGSLGGYEILISTPHLLEHSLERDYNSIELEQRLLRFYHKGNYDGDWEGAVRDFVEQSSDLSFEVGPYFAEGEAVVTEFQDHHLDQDFWAFPFRRYKDIYVVLRVKQGGATGAGYSDPAVFKVLDVDNFQDWFIRVQCPECDMTLDESQLQLRDEVVYCKRCGRPAFVWHWTLE